VLLLRRKVRYSVSEEMNCVYIGKGMATSGRLQIVILFGKGNGFGLRQLLGIYGHEFRVDGHLGGSESGCSHEVECGVTNKLPRKPQEWLLEVIVRLGTNLEVLQVLLAMEGDSASLYFPLLDIDFVSAKHDWDALADTLKVTMPVGHVLVRDTRRDIKHDDTALALDVVSVTETTELLLSSGVPHVEADGSEVGRELQRVNLDTEGGDVFFLEFTSQMALDKSGLSSSSIANENELECGDVRFRHDDRSRNS